MPTNRRKRMRRPKEKPDNSDYRFELALTGECRTTPDNVWAVFVYRFDQEARRAFWQANLTKILKDWIAKRPGLRPYDWWRYDAPGFRLKISEDGPSNEELAESSGFGDFGIPDHYSDPYEIEKDKPIFESQPAYLERCGLLTSQERRKLGPEAITQCP